MTWLTYPYYTVPTPNLVVVPNGSSITIMADANYDMAQAISQDIKGFIAFLAASPDPQYANPTAYALNLIAYAQSLVNTSYAQYTVPKGWNPVAVALQFANTVFATLSQIPVNANDPNTVSVFTAWTGHTGQLLGGNPTPPTVVSGTPVTGQGAAPTGSIL
jgi:hypothetical protein